MSLTAPGQLHGKSGSGGGQGREEWRGWRVELNFSKPGAFTFHPAQFARSRARRIDGFAGGIPSRKSWPSRPRARQNSPPGWRKICRRASASWRCPWHIRNGCAPRTRSNGSIRRSNAAPASSVSSPMKPPSSASSLLSLQRPAKIGNQGKSTSTWNANPSPQFNAHPIYRKKFARPLLPGGLPLNVT